MRICQLYEAPNVSMSSDVNDPALQQEPVPNRIEHASTETDESNLGDKLDIWLQNRGIKTPSDKLLNGISAGVFVSLYDALESGDDVEIVSVLRQIKSDNDNKGLLDRAESEIEEDISSITDPMQMQQMPSSSEQLSIAKDMQNKLKSSNQMKGTVATGTPGQNLDIDIQDINFDETNPELATVAITSKTRPGEVDMVPLNAVSMMEGLSRIINKQVLSESKVTIDIYGNEVMVSNEEIDMINRIMNVSFLEDIDLAQREKKICTDIHSRGIITRAKLNGKMGYKMKNGGKL